MAQLRVGDGAAPLGPTLSLTLRNRALVPVRQSGWTCGELRQDPKNFTPRHEGIARAATGSGDPGGARHRGPNSPRTPALKGNGCVVCEPFPGMRLCPACSWGARRPTAKGGRSCGSAPRLPPRSRGCCSPPFPARGAWRRRSPSSSTTLFPPNPTSRSSGSSPGPKSWSRSPVASSRWRSIPPCSWAVGSATVRSGERWRGRHRVDGGRHDTRSFSPS